MKNTSAVFRVLSVVGVVLINRFQVLHLAPIRCYHRYVLQGHVFDYLKTHLLGEQHHSDVAAAGFAWT